MFKKTLMVAGGSLLIGLSFGAVAGHGGGGGGGGAAAGHESHAAMMNSNGPSAGDRDKGQQRAEDRRSAAGAGHEKAQDNRMHNKGKHAQKK